MGKTVKSPSTMSLTGGTDHDGILGGTNVNISGNSSGSGSHSISLVSLVLYVLCITSLGASVYSNFRQSHIEDRLRHLRHLDDRVSMLEAKLQTIEVPADFVDGTSAEFSDVANVVRKLSLQVAGIQRLRRDVSHLQVSRREQRQASISQSVSPECVCPPGL